MLRADNPNELSNYILPIHKRYHASLFGHYVRIRASRRNPEHCDAFASGDYHRLIGNDIAVPIRE